MSVRFVRFIGGPKDGETEWVQDASYVRVAEIPSRLPAPFGARPEQRKEHIYWIDERPGPDGIHNARLSQ